MIAALAATLLALAQQSPAQHTTARGITGSFTMTHTGQPLQAKIDQSLTAPLLVRVTDVTPTGSDSDARTYRIDYIGAVAGTFDLRTLIDHRDGTAATELAPLEVHIVSELPAKFGTDLFGDPPEPMFSVSHYRLTLASIAAVWIAVPLGVLVRRWLRRVPPCAPLPPVRKPTFADQLRPLVEAAMQRELSVEDQARLELLLLAFWSERRALGHLAPAEAITELRSDPDASPLLLAVESWLHSGQQRANRPSDDLATLLEPYRAYAPIESSQATP